MSNCESVFKSFEISVINHSHAVEDCIYIFFECPFHYEAREILFLILKRYVVPIELILAVHGGLYKFQQSKAIFESLPSHIRITQRFKTLHTIKILNSYFSRQFILQNYNIAFSFLFIVCIKCIITILLFVIILGTGQYLLGGWDRCNSYFSLKINLCPTF